MRIVRHPEVRSDVKGKVRQIKRNRMGPVFNC